MWPVSGEVGTRCRVVACMLAGDLRISGLSMVATEQTDTLPYKAY